jgi:hypothetical protein
MRIVAGLLTGVGVGFIAGSLSLLIEMGILLGRVDTAGTGTLASTSGPAWFPLVALLGFIGGFVWQYNRSASRR